MTFSATPHKIRLSLEQKRLKKTQNSTHRQLAKKLRSAGPNPVGIAEITSLLKLGSDVVLYQVLNLSNHIIPASGRLLSLLDLDSILLFCLQGQLTIVIQEQRRTHPRAYANDIRLEPFQF